MARKRVRSEALPVREELLALAHHYLHVHNELERTNPGSSARRRLEQKVVALRERFDRTVDEWVDDDGLRERWREYLESHAVAPDEPPAVPPLVFRGTNDAGSVAEVHRGADELRVYVDGSLFARVEPRTELSSTTPGLTFRIDGFSFRETFDVPDEALDALAGEAGEPPWDVFRDLLADGIVGGHFDLTPRGRRALGARSQTGQ